MSKKKFKKGLESLFGDWGGEPIEDVVLELERTEEPQPSVEEPTPHSVKDTDKRANAGKNFTTDLDSLFQEVMHESIEEQFEIKKEEEKAKKKKIPVAKKKKKERPKRRVIPRSGGLDSCLLYTSPSPRD